MAGAAATGFLIWWLIMYKIGIGEDEKGGLQIKGQIEVPNWPAVGDRFDLNNVIAGKPVKFHGEIIRLIKHPPDRPNLDAIIVVKLGAIQQVRPSNV